ncbi:unnamed protein product, partial [marine sediment metagenome]
SSNPMDFVLSEDGSSYIAISDYRGKLHLTVFSKLGHRRVQSRGVEYPTNLIREQKGSLSIDNQGNVYVGKKYLFGLDLPHQPKAKLPQ